MRDARYGNGVNNSTLLELLTRGAPLYTSFKTKASQHGKRVPHGLGTAHNIVYHERISHIHDVYENVSRNEILDLTAALLYICSCSCGDIPFNFHTYIRY